MQVKLLRVLQDRQFERLGGNRTLSVDVRVVAATHRELEQMTARGTFREDLYYRLNVISIWVPPLRERGADVDELARHFCALHGRTNGKPGLAFDEGALPLLRAQPWPGNVRQLQNFVERLVVLSDRASIGAADVERELARHAAHGQPRELAAESEPERLDSRRSEAEREAIVDALRRCGNNRTQAARVLGISRRTLYNKLEELSLL
jgi:two-component system response regulator AtoC